MQGLARLGHTLAWRLSTRPFTGWLSHGNERCQPMPLLSSQWGSGGSKLGGVGPDVLAGRGTWTYLPGLGHGLGPGLVLPRVS